MTPSPKKSFNWGRFSKTLSFWILVILIPVAFLTYGNGRESQAPELDYNAYRQQLEVGNIKSATFQTDNVLAGQFNQPVRVNNREARRFVTRLVPGAAEKEQARLFERGVRTNATEPRANFGSLLITVLPYVLLIGFWIFLFRQMQAGGNKAFSFGKSKAKLLSRRRRSQSRATGNHRVPEGPAEVHQTGRPPAEGCAAGRSAGYGQNAARQGRGR